ncbi:MAG: ATP-binding cassette domain-containing protein [Actinomycetes bacterium]
MSGAGLGLSVTDFGWRHPGRARWAVRNVNFDVSPGERVLITGASGSGKSTLLRSVAALADPQDAAQAEGSICYTADGLVLDASRARRRIGLLMQDPETNLLMTRVGDDVAFGLENAQLPRQLIWPAVQTALDQVGFRYSLDRPTSALSGGEKQRVGLAGSLARGPGLLILDEPTANLDPEGAAVTVESIRQVLDATGSTMLLVEHRLPEVLGLVDRMILLSPDGLLADGPPARVLAEHGDQLARAGVFVTGWRGTIRLPALPAQSDRVMMVAKEVVVDRGPARQRVLAGVSMTATGATATAIVGANGAGKSTLARVLGGLLTPTSGVVQVPGSSKPLHKLRSRRLARAVGSVFQEPEHQFVAGTVAAELVVGARAVGMGKASAYQCAEHLLAALGLAGLREANPHTLSGGEKRRLAVAAALVADPPVLVLDEPTFGQDVNSWASIVELLIDQLNRGTALVVITHDKDLVEALGARVLTLSEGHLAQRSVAAPGHEAEVVTA